MKTPTKKKALEKAIEKDVVDAVTKVAQELGVKRSKYVLTAEMNNELYMIEGEDETMFAKLQKPPKYTTKGVFTLLNRETGKSFDIVFPPVMARKLMINPFVQVVQWKRMSGKVA